MPVTVIVGAQWGDEGKGKVTDFLAGSADVVARYQGGNNAGHTVTVGAEEYKLQLLPSGSVHPDVKNVLGNGLVIDPAALLAELQKLHAKLKDRGDIALVTVNADFDLSLVKPYLDEFKYTFPVLVNAQFKDIALPTNYILDSKGVARWQSTGYDNAPGWVDRTFALLEKTK